MQEPSLTGFPGPPSWKPRHVPATSRTGCRYSSRLKQGCNETKVPKDRCPAAGQPYRGGIYTRSNTRPLPGRTQVNWLPRVQATLSSI